MSDPPVDKNSNLEEDKGADSGTTGQEMRTTKPASKFSCETLKRRNVLVWIGAALLLILALVLIIVPLVLYRGSPSSDSQSSSRLDRWLIPRKYDLRLKTYIPSDGALGSDRRPSYPSELNFTFDGNVSIYVDCLKSIDSILLNAKKLNTSADNVKVTEVDSEGRTVLHTVPVSDVQLIAEKEQLRISLQEALEKGKSYRISILYRGEHGSDLSGFYRSSYVEKGATR